jgi:hypothetical protein
MLDIKLSDGTRRSWHVGQGNPVGYYEVEDVEEVQADGDELDHIQNMFLKTAPLPIPRNRVVRWFGDHAKLIMGNL